ncbi:MAG: ABC transporter permease [Prevotellaceae bacterium]|nr:ABC transporter permease [Prevotellaceae bacterium]MDY3364893.1 ABC transporter permease [Prevotella sp.]
MRKAMTWQSVLWQVMQREVKRLLDRPLYFFCMVAAPLFCYVFFTTLMADGLPANLPAGWVDMDQSGNSRKLERTLNAMPQTDIVARYPNISEARKAIQEGEIYGFFYIPKGFTKSAQTMQQPLVSFYTNQSYLVAGSLLFRDMKMMGELSGAGASRSVLLARGAGDEQAMALLRPIIIDARLLNNPWTNYAVYLNNTIIPGILMLLIFMVTVFSIGTEIKEGTNHEWLRMSGKSVPLALLGKFLPHTLVFTAMALLYNAYLYGFLHYPLNSGIFPMLLASFLLVISSQSMGILMFGILPTLRLGLSFASLWGVLSFSICGFSFPVMAMPPMIQALSWLFPLRHYFLIYVDQALNGYDMSYSWVNYTALLIFMALPLLVLRRLKSVLIYHSYRP